MTRTLKQSALCTAALLTAAALLVISCSGSSTAQTSASTTNATSPTAATVPVVELLEGLPAEARVTTGGGDPRPPAYWAVWNTCAPDNRAAEAEANGGAPAGWVLIDDLLADPGIGLGDHAVTSCEESVALLQASVAGIEIVDPAFMLAGQLLAAELNLNVGAETCPTAEEAVVGAHLVLSSANFDGASPSALEDEAGGAAPRLVELLRAYNSGELCR